MADDDKPDETPWYAPGHASAFTAKACTPRERERLWTLTKGGKRIDAELLYQGEAGVEVQFLHQGEMTMAWRFSLRAGAIAEADAQYARLLRDGWTAPVTSHPAD
jgi:hypothetical protein